MLSGNGFFGGNVNIKKKNTFLHSHESTEFYPLLIKGLKAILFISAQFMILLHFYLILSLLMNLRKNKSYKLFNCTNVSAQLCFL